MSSSLFYSSGFGFVRVLFETYWGNYVLPGVFLLCIILTIIFAKKLPSRLLFFETIILLVTVYNPFLVRAFVNSAGFGRQYYRLFWILPVVPGLAYYGARAFFAIKKKLLRFFFVAGVFILLTQVGQGIPGITAGGFSRAENLSKVPDELIQICRILHGHIGLAEPKVAFEAEQNQLVRQYDAAIMPVIYRDAALYRAGALGSTWIDTESAWYKNQITLVDFLDYGQQPPIDTFKAAVEALDADYLVVRIDREDLDYLTACGFAAIAATDHYLVCLPENKITT